MQWLQKAYEKADVAVDLGTFASEYQTFGEKVIAAETVSIFNDKFFGQWLMMFRPFRDARSFLHADIKEKVPVRYQLFACALRAAPEHWEQDLRIREEMELAAQRDAYIQTALAMVAAQRHLVQKYLASELDATDEVPEPIRPGRFDAPGLQRPAFNKEQMDLEEQALKRLELVEAVQTAKDEAEMEQAMEELESKNSILVCMGGPGTGKSFVADYLIRLAVERGHRVLYALPTGQLACRMRQRHPDIHVDTCAGALLLYRPLSETIAILTEYDMVVIDEAWQLSAEAFGRIHSMFLAAGKQLLLLLMGDDWQLPSIDPERVSDHPQWRFTYTVTLRQVVRCKDPVLQEKLDLLRHHKPTGAEGKKFVNKLCHKHKAWTGHHEPTALDIEKVLRDTGGETTFVTCTKAGAAWINACAVQVLFHNRKKPRLAEVPGGYEDWPENYTEQGALRTDRPPVPSQMALYRGMRIILTKNLNKQAHYVNGMVAEVESFDPATGCLQVVTQSGKRLPIYRYTDTGVPKGKVTYFPVRAGYAGTIYKQQGAELKHVTLWLDRKFTRAAAYVALSRVERDHNYLIGGIVTADHLVPAK